MPIAVLGRRSPAAGTGRRAVGSGVELMNNFISDTGCFKHWDGRVSDADYELSKRQLADGIARVFEP
ncbi:hypothetical protein BDFG_03204 [Blastomyces dermatitidis ATCC 26199]|nr:hypothetical protein BDFG_03204 [Blastomyces dermatitidis ATCC 26199]